MNRLSNSDLHFFLDAKYQQYNQSWFIDTDPIQVPHSYVKKEDIEISAFLSASIAWGKRNLIIQKAKEIMQRMDFQPYEFIKNAEEADFSNFNSLKYRTFKPEDFKFFIKSLQNIYLKHNGLETIFTRAYQKNKSIKEAISEFRKFFFEIPHPERTSKHISNVDKNSAAKRINMFLMWMIRNDNQGVHFGLWKNIEKAHLYLPLDTHTSRIGRELGLLSRKQNDWRAVVEITKNLRKFDISDPVKYDFALFGYSNFEKNHN